MRFGPAQRRRAAGNGHKVLESLFDRPILSVSDVQKMTGTTYAAANGLVSRLVKLEVLSEMTGYARNRRFRYAPTSRSSTTWDRANTRHR